LNPGRRGGKPTTNRLSYGAALAPIDFESDHPIFTSSDFANNNFFLYLFIYLLMYFIYLFYRPKSPALGPDTNLESHVSVFTSPSDRAAQAAGSLFIAFYDSQGYGGAIPHVSNGSFALYKYKFNPDHHDFTKPNLPLPV
jgi:hypothetical protein